MIFRIKPVWLFCLLLLSACADPQIEALSERWAKHDWSSNQDKHLMLDINNDGVKERALIGYGNTIVVVAYIQDKIHLMDFVEIFTNNPAQSNAICASKAELTIQPQKHSLAEQLGVNPEGYRFCDTCQGLRLDDGLCDPFNIYWDHQRNMLRWWRN